MAKKTSDAAPTNRRRATTPRRVTAPRQATTSDPVTTTNDLPATAQSGPSADEIAQEAYLRYLSRGAGDGQDFDDWLDAERELKKRRNGG